MGLETQCLQITFIVVIKGEFCIMPVGVINCVIRLLTQLYLFLKPKMFQQLRAELAAIWNPREDWRSLRRITKRAKRRALLYGELLEQELEPKHNPEDDEDLTMKVLLLLFLFSIHLFFWFESSYLQYPL